MDTETVNEVAECCTVHYWGSYYVGVCVKMGCNTSNSKEMSSFSILILCLSPHFQTNQFYHQIYIFILFLISSPHRKRCFTIASTHTTYNVFWRDFVAGRQGKTQNRSHPVYPLRLALSEALPRKPKSIRWVQTCQKPMVSIHFLGKNHGFHCRFSANPWIPWDLRSSPSTASELRLVEDTPTCSQPPKVFGMMRIVYYMSVCWVTVFANLHFFYLDGLRCSSSDRSAKCPGFHVQNCSR